MKPRRNFVKDVNTVGNAIKGGLKAVGKKVVDYQKKHHDRVEKNIKKYGGGAY